MAMECTGPVSITSTAPRGESRVYTIEGMTSDACAVTVDRTIAGLPGVARAEVSFDSKTARIFFAEGAIRSPARNSGSSLVEALSPSMPRYLSVSVLRLSEGWPTP